MNDRDAILEVIRQEAAAVVFFEDLLLAGAAPALMARYVGLRRYHQAQIARWRGRL